MPNLHIPLQVNFAQR